MKKCINLSIGTTTITKEIDGYPDLSFYGEYTSNIKPGVIIREHKEFYEKIPTEMERDTGGRFYQKKAPEWSHYYNQNEYPGFKPYSSGEKIGTEDFYRYGMEKYKRMESYNNGHWCMISIVVRTTIKMDIGSDYVHSSLCGIESDSGAEYIKEIISDLKSENKAELLKIGFSESEIDRSLDNAEIKEEW